MWICINRSNWACISAWLAGACQVTTTVDVSAYIEQKRAALEAHRTQMGPEQFFMQLPRELFAEAFGRETFQRIAGPGPASETDLFEGLNQP